MNQQTLKGFQMLADAMPKSKAKVTYSENGKIKSVECDYSPLTGTISLGKIACSKSELPKMVKLIYPNAEIISINI